MEDGNSVNPISMLDLDPGKTKRIADIDKKIQDIFGDDTTNRFATK